MKLSKIDRCLIIVLKRVKDIEWWFDDLIFQLIFDRDRATAAELSRLLVMSPVVSDISSSADEFSMPISLASNADHVVQKLKLLEKVIDALSDTTERQRDDVEMYNGVILSAEEQIDNARQVRLIISTFESTK